MIQLLSASRVNAAYAVHFYVSEFFRWGLDVSQKFMHEVLETHWRRRYGQTWAQYIVSTVLRARKVPYETDTDTCKSRLIILSNLIFL
jgi:hypothetical protein